MRKIHHTGCPLWAYPLYDLWMCIDVFLLPIRLLAPVPIERGYSSPLPACRLCCLANGDRPTTQRVADTSGDGVVKTQRMIEHGYD